MSRFLRDVLENESPLFATHIAELEKMAGQTVSVRMVADILERAHEVMRRIGVDTADTTAEELYYALCTAAQNHDIDHLLRKTSWVVLPFVDGPVSFNLQDVVDNAHHELTFAERKGQHGQRQLRRELTRRFNAEENANHTKVDKLAKQAHLLHENDGDFRDISTDLSASGKPSLLAIGDIFTDAFIELDEEVARVDTDDDGSKRLSLPLGSKPPYKGVEIVKAVGPSPNAAVSCARLGLDVSLLAWLGTDATQEEAIAQLKKENIDTSLVDCEKGRKSNYYFVLRYGAERTILVKNEDYEYNWELPKTPPDWIYLSLISDKSWELHEDLLAYLDTHKHTKLVFQPGTFHFKWGKEKLAKIYKRSYMVVMNREEAVDVTGESYDDLPKLMDALHELGPEIVVITDGPNGSYASQNGRRVTVPNYPDPAPPLDRTGAGDAFASTITAALAMGKDLDTALLWAPINSMNVVQKLGAQTGLLKMSQIEKYLKEAPKNYKVSEL